MPQCKRFQTCYWPRRCNQERYLSCISVCIGRPATNCFELCQKESILPATLTTINGVQESLSPDSKLFNLSLRFNLLAVYSSSTLYAQESIHSWTQNATAEAAAAFRKWFLQANLLPHCTAWGGTSNIIKPQKERKKVCEYPVTVTLILYISRDWRSEVCCQPSQGFAVNSVARCGFMELCINCKADPFEAWVAGLRNNTAASNRCGIMQCTHSQSIGS